MKVEDSAIKKYTLSSWIKWDEEYHRRNGGSRVQYGIDVVMMDGKKYHVCDDDKPLFYATRKEAMEEINRMNSELNTTH